MDLVSPFLYRLVKLFNLIVQNLWNEILFIWKILQLVEIKRCIMRSGRGLLQKGLFTAQLWKWGSMWYWNGYMDLGCTVMAIRSGGALWSLKGFMSLLLRIYMFVILLYFIFVLQAAFASGWNNNNKKTGDKLGFWLLPLFWLFGGDCMSINTHHDNLLSF